MKKIFVNIASYRDNLLAATLYSLMKNESGRNQITYGVFEQNHYENSLEKTQPDLVYDPRVRYKLIGPEFSDGVVWARSINAMQLDDEEYMYQIDSHMLFDKNWDHHLILDFNRAKSLSGDDKVILSSGTKNFELNGNQIVKHTLTEDITVKFGYYQFRKDLQLRVHGPWISATEEVTPGIHAVAGNFFTVAKWVKDVGYNTRLFFDLEEQFMAISSILAGYKIFHQRRVKCYHYLGAAKHKSKQDIEPVIPMEKIDYKKRRETEEFINYIYSLTEEQLNYYKEITGVDYINRKLEDRAISRIAKPDPSLEVDWEIPIISESEPIKADEEPSKEIENE